MLDRFYYYGGAHKPGPYYDSTYGGGDLLTGAGWFDQTELYYGTYSNSSISLSGASSADGERVDYSLPSAYLYTTVSNYAFALFVLAVRWVATFLCNL